MQYFVLTDDGNRFGPADFAMLQQWANEHRIVPTSRIVDPMGQTVLAHTIIGLQFPLAPPPGMGQPQGEPFTGYPRGYGATGAPASSTDTALLVKAILSTVLCCMPLGIAAIVFVVQAGSHASHGRTLEAADANRKAHQFANWSIGIGIVTNGIWFLLMIIGAFLD